MDAPLSLYNEGSLSTDVSNVLVYPASTRVRIIGNKRTRPSLMGQEGIVIKTVGLGGWHWLQLKNGKRIKVQRNALCLADSSNGCVSCYDAESTPSEKSSTFGCPEVSLYKVRSSGGINLHKLSTEALLKYAQLHCLSIGPKASRALLLKHVWWHFESSVTDESSVLSRLTEKGWDCVNMGSIE
eukprot:g6544.t1